MIVKRFWAVALIMACIASAAAAGWYHCTRPRCLTGIPRRDYQHRSFSQHEVSVSRTAILLKRPADARRGLPAKRIKVYQLDRAKLQIDHCCISRLALQLHEDGGWRLSLRGDQNLEGQEAGPPGVAPGTTYTAHLKRNKFFLKFRCYGQYKVEGREGEDTLGRPVMARLAPVSFWVQNGQPRDYHTRGADPDLVEYFDLIDRVEVEFYYH